MWDQCLTRVAEEILWFGFCLCSQLKSKCQLSGCLFSPENEWQWQLWCAITMLLWFVFRVLWLDACGGRAMKVEYGIWYKQTAPPYFLIKPCGLGGKMGRRRFNVIIQDFSQYLRDFCFLCPQAEYKKKKKGIEKGSWSIFRGTG